MRSPNDPSVLISNSEIFPIAEVDDNEFRPPEAELDEHHPKATRTLFVGNLEKDISNQELRERFLKFGEILVSITKVKYTLKVKLLWDGERKLRLIDK